MDINKTIINRLRETKTMPELDAMRRDVVSLMMEGPVAFNGIQKEFIKAKNRLKRIPLKDRTW